MSSPQTAERTRPPLWLFAIACGLIVALVHLAYVGIRLHVFNRFTWTSRDIVWMAPVAYLGLFLIAAGLSALLVRLVRRPWGEALLAALAAWSLLLLFQTLHPIATIVLALGIGVMTAGAWHRAYRASPTRLRRAVGGIALLTLAIAGGTVAARWVPRMMARNGEAPPADAPNVLLLILDTVRAQSMSLYGYAHPTTPHLARLAREGTVFEHAFATSSWSLQSHAGLLTGLWAHEVGGDYLRPVRRDARMVAEAFRERGYATGGFTANVGFVGHETGLARGYEHFEDYPRSLAQLLLTPTLSQTEAVREAIVSAENGYLRGIVYAFRPMNLRLVGVRLAPRKLAPDVTNAFLHWSERVGKRPYFAFINVMDAHSPYESPEPFRSAFGNGKREVDRYHGAIAYLDSVVYDALSALQRRGELDRTLVVITADHGELFGEHGFEGHGNTLYLPVWRVPLVMRLPSRVPAGLRVNQPVSLRDLPATLVDLAGIRTQPAFPGASLRVTWTPNATATASPVIGEAAQGVNVPPSNQTYYGPLRSTLDSAMHYIRLARGGEELYAWRTDPDESVNLAGRPEHAGTLARYRGVLDSVYRSSQGSNTLGGR